MSAAAKSLNAVKAALANLQLMRERGHLGVEHRDFAHAGAGLRIDDLAAVVALAESVEALTVLEPRARLEAAESLVADQLELLTETTTALDAARGEIAALREGLRKLMPDVEAWREQAHGYESSPLLAARTLLASPAPGRKWLMEWGKKVAHHAWRLGFFRGREYEEMDTLEAMRRADEFSLTNEAAAALVESLLPEGGK